MIKTLGSVTLLLGVAASGAEGRTWTDNSGQYTLDADLVAFDHERAVLKRTSDGELGLIEIDRLGEADAAFLAEQRTAAESAESVAPLWTLRGGLEIPGRVVDYTRREVTLRRRRGKVYVNDRVFENLPAVYRKIVPLIVAEQTGNQVDDEDSLKAWLVHLKGEPQTFVVDGVVMQLGDGDQYGLPFFLFSDNDLTTLQPGWEEWLAAQGDARESLSLSLEARAAESRASEAKQLRVAQLQLAMSAIDAGVTSLWEVTLYPGRGVAGAPVWAVVPGRDSRAASQRAIANYPGYTLGPVRRVSR